MATSGIVVMGEVLDWLDGRIGAAVSRIVLAMAVKNTGLEDWHLADSFRGGLCKAVSTEPSSGILPSC
jgi:hypothetical protein